MKKVIMGNHAASWAVMLSRVQVIAAYPITPQTQIVEELSEMCADGRLNAKFLKVESEHSAMSSCIAAAATGVRTFTATSSAGLALMHETLHWASGARLPVVMVNVNRALFPGWNIWADQTDSLAQRDTGWIQIYVEDNQEVLDSVIMAYRIAEIVNLPVMVCYDAFFLSHTYEPVDLPTPEQVDGYLPPYRPTICLDPKDPHSFFGLTMPDVYMETRYKIQQAMERVPATAAQAATEFAATFGRSYSAVEEIGCADAETVLVATSTTTSPARVLAQRERARGRKLGVLKLRFFRPFPVEECRRALAGKKRVVVIDRNISFGKGGIWADELRGALAGQPNMPMVYGCVTGLGGRDITPELLAEIVADAEAAPQADRLIYWKGLRP